MHTNMNLSSKAVFLFLYDAIRSLAESNNAHSLGMSVDLVLSLAPSPQATRHCSFNI